PTSRRAHDPRAPACAATLEPMSCCPSPAWNPLPQLTGRSALTRVRDSRGPDSIPRALATSAGNTSATRAMLSCVVNEPRLMRSAALATLVGTPSAVRTCEADTDPL